MHLIASVTVTCSCLNDLSTWKIGHFIRHYKWYHCSLCVHFLWRLIGWKHCSSYQRCNTPLWMLLFLCIDICTYDNNSCRQHLVHFCVSALHCYFIFTCCIVKIVHNIEKSITVISIMGAIIPNTISYEPKWVIFI